MQPTTKTRHTAHFDITCTRINISIRFICHVVANKQRILLKFSIQGKKINRLKTKVCVQWNFKEYMKKRSWTFLDVWEINGHIIISVISGLFMVEAKSMEKLMFYCGNIITVSPNGEVLPIGNSFPNIRKTSRSE